MAPTLVQQTSARKVWNSGLPFVTSYAGAVTAGNTLVAVISLGADALGPPAFDTPAGWTYDGRIKGRSGGTEQNRPHFYLYRKRADGTETGFSSVMNPPLGTSGNLYVAEYANVPVGAATMTTGSFPSDGLSGAHTAIADEVALHIFYDGPCLATTATWDTSSLAGENGSAMTQYNLLRTAGFQTVVSVLPVTYSVAGAKSGLPFVSGAYDSELGIATLAFGAIAQPIDEDAPITVDLRLVKVRETDPPYQVPA